MTTRRPLELSSTWWILPWDFVLFAQRGLSKSGLSRSTNCVILFRVNKVDYLLAREISDHQKWTWWKLGGHTVRSACFLLRSRACWAYHVAPFATTLAQAVKYSRKTGERAGSRLEPTLVHKSTHCKPYKLLGWCYHAKVVKQSKLEYHTFHVIHTIFATTTTQESWCDIWNCLPKPVVGPSDHHWALTNWSHFCSILLKPLLPEVWKRI